MNPNNLPKPNLYSNNGGVWLTYHPIRIDGEIIHDGVVRHDHPTGVAIGIHDVQELNLTYSDARRVVRAIIAALDEAGQYY